MQAPLQVLFVHSSTITLQDFTQALAGVKYHTFFSFDTKVEFESYNITTVSFAQAMTMDVDDTVVYFTPITRTFETKIEELYAKNLCWDLLDTKYVGQSIRVSVKPHCMKTRPVYRKVKGMVFKPDFKLKAPWGNALKDVIHNACGGELTKYAPVFDFVLTRNKAREFYKPSLIEIRTIETKVGRSKRYKTEMVNVCTNYVHVDKFVDAIDQNELKMCEYKTPTTQFDATNVQSCESLVDLTELEVLLQSAQGSCTMVQVGTLFKLISGSDRKCFALCKNPCNFDYKNIGLSNVDECVFYANTDLLRDITLGKKELGSFEFEDLEKIINIFMKDAKFDDRMMKRDKTWLIVPNEVKIMNLLRIIDMELSEYDLTTFGINNWRSILSFCVSCIRTSFPNHHAKIVWLCKQLFILATKSLEMEELLDIVGFCFSTKELGILFGLELGFGIEDGVVDPPGVYQNWTVDELKVIHGYFMTRLYGSLNAEVLEINICNDCKRLVAASTVLKKMGTLACKRAYVVENMVLEQGMTINEACEAVKLSTEESNDPMDISAEEFEKSVMKILVATMEIDYLVWKTQIGFLAMKALFEKDNETREKFIYYRFAKSVLEITENARRMNHNASTRFKISLLLLESANALELTDVVGVVSSEMDYYVRKRTVDMTGSEFDEKDPKKPK